MVCPILWSVFAIVNVVGLFAARHDKKVARARSRRGDLQRIPERILWLVAALGGGLGMAVAFKAYRHKTRKWRFLVVFWLAALLGLAAWGGWLAAFGCLEALGV